MKNFKDITLSIFAIIGFVAILSSFNNQSQTQDTKVWTMVSSDVGGAGSPNMYVLNQATGEIRYFDEQREKAIIPPK